MWLLKGPPHLAASWGVQLANLPAAAVLQAPSGSVVAPVPRIQGPSSIGAACSDKGSSITFDGSGTSPSAGRPVQELRWTTTNAELQSLIASQTSRTSITLSAADVEDLQPGTYTLQLNATNWLDATGRLQGRVAPALRLHNGLVHWVCLSTPFDACVLQAPPPSHSRKRRRSCRLCLLWAAAARPSCWHWARRCRPRLTCPPSARVSPDPCKHLCTISCGMALHGQTGWCPQRCWQDGSRSSNQHMHVLRLNNAPACRRQEGDLRVAGDQRPAPRLHLHISQPAAGGEARGSRGQGRLGAPRTCATLPSLPATHARLHKTEAIIMCSPMSPCSRCSQE